MIPVEMEDVEELKKWGMNLEKVLENCEFCNTPTRYWHVKTNNPVCQECAKHHKVSELRNWMKNSA